MRFVGEMRRILEICFVSGERVYGVMGDVHLPCARTGGWHGLEGFEWFGRGVSFCRGIILRRWASHGVFESVILGRAGHGS